jgi:hypothetical protein
MTNIILAGYVAMVLLFVIGVVWEMNARRRGRLNGTDIAEDRRRRGFERSRRVHLRA